MGTNILGWGNAGSAYGYRPYVQQNYPTAHNPLSTKNAVRVSDTIRSIQTDAAVATGIEAKRASAQTAAKDLINAVRADATTVEGQANLLRRTLDRIKPGAGARAQTVATQIINTGFATTADSAYETAVADELMRMDPVQSCQGDYFGDLGRTVAEWVAENVGDRLRVGRGGRTSLSNVFFDWHCSPASTAVGSAIVSIWTGPAGGQAAAEGSHAIKTAAGCDLWSAGAQLARQEGMSREVAMDEIKRGLWIRDPKVQRWYRSKSWQGMWVRARPLVPWVAGGIGIMAVLRALRK